MAQWDDIQSDFTGGEISTRMFMRAGTEVYEKSVGQMLNFMPSLQGTVQRTPGTKYVGQIPDGEGFAQNARLIPFTDATNKRGFIALTDTGLTRYTDLEELAQPIPDDVPVEGLKVSTETTRPFDVTPNGRFVNGLQSWDYDPEEYTFNKDNVPAGVFIDDAFANSQAAVMRPVLLNENTDPAFQDTVFIATKTKFDVEQAINTTGFQLDLDVTLNSQEFPFAKHEGRLTIGTTEGGSDVLDVEFEIELVGGTYRYPQLIDTLPAGFDGPLYQRLEFKAIANDKQGEKAPNSIPTFVVRRFRIIANRRVESAGEDIELPPGGVPWTADDLKDIHFIQSPYGADRQQPAPDDYEQELVLVHPNWPPHWIRFGTTGYKLEEIPFKDNNNGDYQPREWQIGNYPSCVTSYHGRLMLGGGQGFGRVNDTVIQPNTEKVWGTKVGKWNQFSYNPDDGTFDVFPDSSIEFTAKYRSPLQWLYGQKDMLMGSLEFEYIASGEGIFAPGDIGVNMHSSHGSNHVQPVAMGDIVLFPGEGGTRVRAMGKDINAQGWIAPDLTLLNPEITSRGIKRMIRMRNPHQMILVLTNDGNISILHLDNNAGLSGWSRMRVGNVQDFCVTVNQQGQDVLWLAIERTIQGEPVLNLEVIDNWLDQEANWGYLNNAISFAGEYRTVIDRLEHLEGKIVHVIATGAPRNDDVVLPTRVQGYLGSFRVIDGKITLRDKNLHEMEVNACTVGLSYSSRLLTLPMGGRGVDPGGPKRFSELSIRIRASIRPRMGVITADQSFEQVAQRGDDRTPGTNMNQSEPLSIFEDVEVASLGWDQYQMVVIQETLPLRCEILGIYGKITANSL